MKDMKSIIATNIIKLRKENKLTQAELAEKLNYSDKAISKWERGESIPDIEILKSLADMFGVTVDYLITENAETFGDKFKLPKQNKANQIAITLLGVSLVWLIATVIYVYGNISSGNNLWTTFIWAVPLTCVVLYVFNRKWGNKNFEFYINTAFNWTLLASLYLQFLTYNIWLVFLIGIPIQVIIVLLASIRGTNIKKK